MVPDSRIAIALSGGLSAHGPFPPPLLERFHGNCHAEH
jgi:hypothetical protein